MTRSVAHHPIVSSPARHLQSVIAGSSTAGAPDTRLCAGYVAKDQAGGNPANITHFQKLLAELPPAFVSPHSVALWVAEQDPGKFLQPFQVRRGLAQHVGHIA